MSSQNPAYGDSGSAGYGASTNTTSAAGGASGSGASGAGASDGRGNYTNPFDLVNEVNRADVPRTVQYACGDCDNKVILKKGDPIRCKECGHRVLYKERTKRMVQFEAR